MASANPLYLMVKLSPALGEYLAGLLCRATGRPVDLLHMTVLEFGDRSEIDPPTFARIIATLDAIRLPSFRIVFDRIGGSDRTILLPSEPPRGAIAFRRALLAGFARHGWRIARSRLVAPHVTFDYRRGVPDAVAIDPISWRVEDIRLIESVVGETRHVEHGRWALGTD